MFRSNNSVNDSLLNEMIRLQKDYARLLKNADEYRAIKNGMPTTTECRFLQQAAEKKSRLVSISAGSGEYHLRHMSDLAELNERIKLLRSQLEGENSTPYYAAAPTANSNPSSVAANAAPSTPSGNASTAAASSNNRPSDSAEASDEDEEEIKTDAWYQEMPKHSFEDVSGMEEVKDKLKTCLVEADLKDLAARLKMSVLNSFFFVGPPGCGKTYIIKAFVHELMTKKNYKYLYLDCSQIITKYVGDSEKIVKKLFEEAVKASPCILFIDEIDGVCRNRSMPSLPEYASSLTTAFLTSYNIINEANSEIIFIGATNYPQKVDEAMLDRVEVVYVGLPDKEARTYAFENAFKGKPDDMFENLIYFERGLTAEYMAECTAGYSYRDIDRVVENIKKKLFDDLSKKLRASCGKYTSGQYVRHIIDSLNNGDYRLKKSTFDEVLEKFVPSNKNQIIADIKDWMEEMRSNDESSGVSSFPDVNDIAEEPTENLVEKVDNAPQQDALSVSEVENAELPEPIIAEENEEIQADFEAEWGQLLDEVVSEQEQELAETPVAESLVENPTEEAISEDLERPDETEEQSSVAEEQNLIQLCKSSYMLEPDGILHVTFRLVGIQGDFLCAIINAHACICTYAEGVYTATCQLDSECDAVKMQVYGNGKCYGVVDIALSHGIDENSSFGI